MSESLIVQLANIKSKLDSLEKEVLLIKNKKHSDPVDVDQRIDSVVTVEFINRKYEEAK